MGPPTHQTEILHWAPKTPSVVVFSKVRGGIIIRKALLLAYALRMLNEPGRSDDQTRSLASSEGVQTSARTRDPSLNEMLQGLHQGLQRVLSVFDSGGNTVGRQGSGYENFAWEFGKVLDEAKVGGKLYQMASDSLAATKAQEKRWQDAAFDPVATLKQRTERGVLARDAQDAANKLTDYLTAAGRVDALRKGGSLAERQFHFDESGQTVTGFGASDNLTNIAALRQWEATMAEVIKLHANPGGPGLVRAAGSANFPEGSLGGETQTPGGKEMDATSSLSAYRELVNSLQAARQTSDLVEKAMKTLEEKIIRYRESSESPKNSPEQSLSYQKMSESCTVQRDELSNQSFLLGRAIGNLESKLRELRKDPRIRDSLDVDAAISDPKRPQGEERTKTSPNPEK